MGCAACARLSTRWGGMMTDACDDRRSDIVDALIGHRPAEREAEFEAHTESCAGCAHEIEELAAVASQLRNTDVDLEAVARPDEPPPDLGARIGVAIERARVEESMVRLAPTHRRSRRITRALLGAAAAVVIAVGAIGYLRDSSSRGAVEVVALAATDTAAGTSATAELRPQPFGTAIDLTVAGLDEGKVYALWLAAASGTRTPAGTFVAGRDGKASLDTSTALPRDKAAKIWITDPDDATVLVAPLS